MIQNCSRMHRLSHSFLWLLLVTAPTAAWSQGALLQGGAPVPGQAPMYSGPPGGSQAVVQASGPAGGGGVGLGLSELLQVNRANGTGPYGSHACLYDNPVTHVGGYHYFCLEAGAGSRALMTVGNGGGASPQPFQFCINGACYDFPFATSGIVGPNTTVVGHVAIWGNTQGTLIIDDGPGLALTGGLTAAAGDFAGTLTAGAVSVTGNAAVGGGIAVTGGVTAGAGSFSGPLTVAGNANFAGGVAITGGLTGAAGTFSGPVTVGTFHSLGATQIDGTFTVNGNISATGGITATGGVTAAAGSFGGALSAGSVSVTTTSQLTGPVVMGSTLAVGNNTTITGTLGVDGGALFANSTFIANALPVSSGGMCIGISNAGALYVSGVAC